MKKLILRTTVRFLLFAGLIIFSSRSFAATELKDRVDPVVTAEWVKEIGADGTSEDAIGAVAEAKKLLGK